MTRISEFSAEYYLIDARIVSYPGDYVACPQDLYRGLESYVDEPLARIGEEHYQLYPEGALPAETVIVPETINADTDDAVLIPKDRDVIETTFTDLE